MFAVHGIFYLARDGEPVFLVERKGALIHAASRFPVCQPHLHADIDDAMAQTVNRAALVQFNANPMQ